MTDEEMINEKKQPRQSGRRRPRKHGSGSVFRRPERRGKQWVAQVVLENGRARQRYFKTEKEADTALNEMLYELRQGTLITEKDQTVKQHFERWLAVHKTKIRHSTYLTYRSAVDKHILSAFGHLPLRKLTAQDLDTFYARKMEEGLSSSRIRAIHTVIYMALQQAVRWKLVARNVGQDASLPRNTQAHDRQTLTPEQAQKLLDAAREHRLEAMLTLALATGMRRGELLALHWQDVDFKNSSLYIQRSVSRLPGGHRVSEPKTVSGKRRIALPPFVAEALQQHRVRQLEAKLRAGPAWEEHDLVITLNIYGHVLPSMQDEAVDKMERLFGKDEGDTGKTGQK